MYRTGWSLPFAVTLNTDPTERIDINTHVALVVRANVDNDRMIFCSSSRRIDLVLLRPKRKEDAKGQSGAQENGHYPLLTLTGKRASQ
jgi:hypothetical protein